MLPIRLLFMMRIVTNVAFALTVATCTAAPLEFVATPGSPFPAGKHAVSPIAIDVDGDRALDIVAADPTGGNITLLRGDGKGRFGEAMQFPAMPSAHLIASGNFDGDKKPDLVVTTHDSNDAVILMNRGGRFTERKTVKLFDGPRGHNHGLVVADIDKDGRDDITVGHQDLDVIAILLGKGDGTFHAPRTYPVGRAPYPHAVADVDGDGRADIVVPNVVGNSVTILRSRGDGTFDPQPPIRVSTPRPYHVAVGRLDRDAHPDLFLTHDDTSVATILFGRERRAVQFNLGFRASGVAIADLNGDSFADVAAAGSGRVRLFMNDGRGALRPGASFESGGWEVVLRDVNGDGRPDVIVPNGEAGTVSVVLASAKR